MHTCTHAHMHTCTHAVPWPSLQWQARQRQSRVQPAGRQQHNQRPSVLPHSKAAPGARTHRTHRGALCESFTHAKQHICCCNAHSCIFAAGWQGHTATHTRTHAHTRMRQWQAHAHTLETTSGHAHHSFRRLLTKTRDTGIRRSSCAPQVPTRSHTPNTAPPPKTHTSVHCITRHGAAALSGTHRPHTPRLES
jgi:hypothetical protein